jgi:PAS domain S-box
MVETTGIDPFVQSSPYPAWLANSRGECIRVNPALEHLIGRTSDQINRADWRSLLFEEDREAASVWQESLASGAPYGMRVRVRRFDGQAQAVELIAYGHNVSDGTEFWFFTGLGVDNTTQQYPPLEAQLQGHAECGTGDDLVRDALGHCDVH